jgi:hypothetical protein
MLKYKYFFVAIFSMLMLPLWAVAQNAPAAIE